MNTKDEFFEEIKDVTAEAVTILKKHECHKTADKLMIVIGRMEGVIKYFEMPVVEVTEDLTQLKETL